MIAYLEGQILLLESDYIIVKTSSDIGYQVYVPSSLISVESKGNTIELYIHAHMREGEFTLYGFYSHSEKQLFELLIRTSGIGPRLGITILSHFPPQQLIQAVNHQDIHTLNTIPGIGKKTATKLCLDMKDHLKKHPIGGFEMLAGKTIEFAPETHSERDELLSALINMGFTEREVLPILRQIQSEELDFEGQLKKSLSLLTSHG